MLQRLCFIWGKPLELYNDYLFHLGDKGQAPGAIQRLPVSFGR